MLDQLKHLLRDRLGLPPWAVLAALGCIAHLALNAALRKPWWSPWGLLAPLLLGIALEAFEIWVQYRQVGVLAPGNDPLARILLRHAADVGRMLAAPVVLVAAGLLVAR